MEIFKEDKETGLSCGVNDLGDLFLGDMRSGYNLNDTPHNRDYIMLDFEVWNKRRHDRMSGLYTSCGRGAK